MSKRIALCVLSNNFHLVSKSSALSPLIILESCYVRIMINNAINSRETFNQIYINHVEKLS